MSEEAPDETPRLICQRVADSPKPHTPSIVCECVECHEKVWMSETSISLSLGKKVTCSRCALPLIKKATIGDLARPSGEQLEAMKAHGITKEDVDNFFDNITNIDELLDLIEFRNKVDSRAVSLASAVCGNAKKWH